MSIISADNNINGGSKISHLPSQDHRMLLTEEYRKEQFKSSESIAGSRRTSNPKKYSFISRTN